MDWVNERQCFRSTTYPLNINSSIKKKTQLVRRIKNIKQDNVESLIRELGSENMERFYSEIICSVLSNKVAGIEDIKNLIRVVMVYIGDLRFIQSLLSELNRTIDDDCSHTDNYWHIILYIEIKIALSSSFDYCTFIKNILSKMSLKVKIFFLEYLKNCFEKEEVIKIYNDEKNKIKSFYLNNDDRNTSKGADKNGNDKLIKACNEIGVEFIVEKSDKDFQKIIDVEENEFALYKSRNTSNVAEYEGPGDLESLKDYVRKHACDMDKIDSLIKYLRKYDNKRMAINLITSFKNRVFYMVPLARMVRAMPTLCRKIVSKSIDDIFDYKGAGINRSDLMCNILFVGELAKYRIISSDDIFNLIDYLFKIRDIETLCNLIENIGRFYLHEEETNYRMREVISRLINYGKQAQSGDASYIHDAITRIFPDNSTNELVKVENFIIFYVNKGNINESGDVFRIFSRNRKFIFSYLVKPWLFTDIHNITKLVTCLSLENTIINYIFKFIEKNYLEKKQKTQLFSKILSNILVSKPEKKQEYYLQRILALQIDEKTKFRIFLVILSELKVSLKLKYYEFIKKGYKDIKDPSLEILLFNFCEQIGVDYNDNTDEDSFDRELRMMEGY